MKYTKIKIKSQGKNEYSEILREKIFNNVMRNEDNIDRT